MTKIKTLTILLTLLTMTKISIAQCDVKKINIGPGIDRYSMTENFYKNADLENGLKTFYVSVNFYGDKADEKKPYVVDLVVTYAWTNYQGEMTPNRLKIQLPSGKEYTLTAEDMSRGTINTFGKTPGNIKSIECTFKLPLDIVTVLLEEKSISKLIVMDYKQDIKFDLSNKYKGQIPEMLYCVIK